MDRNNLNFSPENQVEWFFIRVRRLIGVLFSGLALAGILFYVFERFHFAFAQLLVILFSCLISIGLFFLIHREIFRLRTFMTENIFSPTLRLLHSIDLLTKSQFSLMPQSIEGVFTSKAQGQLAGIAAQVLNHKLFFESVFDVLTDFVFFINFDGEIERVNEAACKICEYENPELIGMAVSEFFVKNDNINQSFLRFKLELSVQKKSAHWPLEFVSRTGKIIPCFWNGLEVSSSAGNTLGYILVGFAK